MKIENKLTRIIDAHLTSDNVLEQDNHVGSKKLTAGYLYQSKRFQLLKYLGVQTKANDVFALRKFSRGRAVEDWFVGMMSREPGLVIETQKDIEYRGVVGKIDIVVDNDMLDFKYGIIPHEVKSVTNRNFKWIHDKGEVSYHHLLQAGLYALALGTDHYGLDYIASDDLRDYCLVMDTNLIKPDIEHIIDGFNEMIENKTVPEWHVTEKWMENPNYMPYDIIWAQFTETQFRKQLESMGIEY